MISSNITIGSNYPESIKLERLIKLLSGLRDVSGSDADVMISDRVFNATGCYELEVISCDDFED